MILFEAQGRLGNQLFQYAFLQTIRENNECIIVSGFDDIENVFEKIKVINIKRHSLIQKCFYRCIQITIRFLVYTKLISTISVIRENVLDGAYTREGDQITYKYGFFRVIKYVKSGFFQSETFFDKDHVLCLNIKKSIVDKAKLFMQNVSDNTDKIFVHIRLGDYKNFYVYGKSTLLAMDYFHNCIQCFINTMKNPVFIFLSDEPDFIDIEFGYVNKKIISSNQSYAVDFAIMTLCNNAILSPSSFGWWGSYFMKKRNVVFAPKHWLGFSSQVDYHKNPVASYMKTIDTMNGIDLVEKIYE